MLKRVERKLTLTSKDINSIFNKEITFDFGEFSTVENGKTEVFKLFTEYNKNVIYDSLSKFLGYKLDKDNISMSLDYLSNSYMFQSKSPYSIIITEILETETITLDI